LIAFNSTISCNPTHKKDGNSVFDIDDDDDDEDDEDDDVDDGEEVVEKHFLINSYTLSIVSNFPLTFQVKNTKLSLMKVRSLLDSVFIF
jgi:hypothetical protein